MEQDNRTITINWRLFNNLIEGLIENASLSNCTSEFKKGKIYAWRAIRDHLEQFLEVEK